MKVAFVVGHEDFPESPSDTPEAYWRVLVPSREFGFAVILGHQNARERALAADVVWIHQPTCFAAAELAEAAQERGTPVVLDFSEDPWARGEVDRGYSEARLEACERTLAAGSLVVATSAALATSFLPWGEARVVPAVVPLGPEWNPALRPSSPACLVERRPPEAGHGAGGSRADQVLKETAAPIDHVQFAHHAPLLKGLETDKERGARAGQLTAYFEDTINLSADGNLGLYRQAIGPATLHLECYARAPTPTGKRPSSPAGGSPRDPHHHHSFEGTAGVALGKPRAVGRHHHGGP